jgi:hypothetical protein
MSTRKNDAEISDLATSIKLIESRVQAVEKLEQTNADRIDALYKTFDVRLTVKDDTIGQIKEQSEWILKQNDTLLKQVGFRWNLLTGLTTFVALAFTITLGYQIWRVEQVMDTKRALEEDTKILAKNTNAYSDVLAKLAHADNLLTASNREFQREEYKVSTTLAEAAIDSLESGLQSTNFDLSHFLNSASFDGTACVASRPTNNSPKVSTILVIEGQAVSFPDQPPKTKVPGISDALSPEVLQSTLLDALFIAYDIHARAAFFFQDNVRADGLTLLALDSNRWQGYHWMGLAAEKEGAGSFPDAEACFRKSVDKNKIGNKDYINLAEISFLQSHYADTIKYTDEYLHPSKYPFVSPLDVVAHFYNSTAGLIAKSPSVKAYTSPKEFRQKFDLLKNVTLQGTFTFSDVEPFLNSPQFLNGLSDAQKAEIEASFNCLKHRQCDK